MSQSFFVFKKVMPVLRKVPDGSAAHPASYSVGTRGFFPWYCSFRGLRLTTHLNIMTRLRMCGAKPP